MNDDLDLAAIEARAAAATSIGYHRDSFNRPIVLTDADGAFVAHARQDIDAICQEVRRLREDRDHARAWACWWRKSKDGDVPSLTGAPTTETSDGWSGDYPTMPEAPTPSDPPA